MARPILEIEQAVLGAMLLKPDVIPDVIQILQKEHFSIETHRRIYGAIVAVYDRGYPVDILTVRTELNQDGQKEIDAMTLINMTESVISPANAEYYAQQVHDAYGLRTLKQICQATAQETDQADFSELVEQHEGRVFQLAQKRVYGKIFTMEESVDAAYRAISDPKKAGLLTGFYELDALTGGLKGGDYVIVASRPSMGKTAFCLSIMQNMAKRGEGSGLFTLETTKEQILNRLMAAQGKINSVKIRTGKLSEEELAHLSVVCAELNNWPIYIDDSGDVSITQIRAKARRMVTQYHPALIVIDYLQLIHSGIRYESRNHEVEEVSGRLRSLAKELDLPIIAVSQLSRKTEGRENKRPGLADLRESGAIEQDATLALFVYRPEAYRIDKFEDGTPSFNLAEIIVGKHKDGPTGDFRLTFLKEFTRFENLEGTHGITDMD